MPTRCSRNEESEPNEPFKVPEFIFIYKDSSTIDWPTLKRFLEGWIGSKTNIVLRDKFISHHLGEEAKLNSIAQRLVRTKVFDVLDPTKTYDPFPVEMKHEKDLIVGSKINVSGVMYDGLRLQKLFRELLPSTELSFKHLHIIFTNRLFGTWEKSDGRYHARVSLYGFPSVISTTGLVEAPAKPREFYVLRKALVSAGMARELIEEELKDKFRERFIDYNDERMTDIVKGYVMQAFFYHTTFEPFCDDKNCRLYNAHWQEDMIHAQLEGSDFCERHERTLERILATKKWEREKSL